MCVGDWSSACALPICNLAEISREIIDGVDYVVSPKFEGKPTGKASSILLFNEAGEFRIIRE